MPPRTHEVSNWRKEQAIKLRNEEFLTYAEIARRMGVSRALISTYLAGTDRGKRNVKPWNEKEAKFPAIARWCNEHNVSKQNLALMLGYSPSTNSRYIVDKAFKTGKLNKQEIDKLIEITGMSYEELFEGAKE